MGHGLRWAAALVACLLVSAAYRQADEKPATTDAVIHAGLRDVINHGADIYNGGDHAGCYRVFDGSLRTLKPLLANRPDLQKRITQALASAEADPVMWRRAFTLRAALDKLRAELNPKKKAEPNDKQPGDGKDGQKKDDPKKDDQDKKKEDDQKKDDQKKDDQKKDEQDKKDDKKDDDKKEDDKDKLTAALREGRGLIRRGNYARAVSVLEGRLALSDGNRDYLRALSDAYAGYIPQLRAEKRLAEMKTYQDRLAVLGPIARPAKPQRQAPAVEKLPPVEGEDDANDV